MICSLSYSSIQSLKALTAHFYYDQLDLLYFGFAEQYCALELRNQWESVELRKKKTVRKRQFVYFIYLTTDAMNIFKCVETFMKMCSNHFLISLI